MKRHLILFTLGIALVWTAGSLAQDTETTPDEQAGMACCSSGESGETMACCTKPAGDESAAGCCSGHGGPSTTDVVAEQGPGGRGGHRGGRGGGGPQGGHGGGEMGSRREVMPNAMALLRNHNSIERTWEEIPGGIRSVTTTSDPNLVALVRQHPREMYAHYKAGGTVRPRDPMFGELGRVSDKIDMAFEDVENGVVVKATSDDPEVVKLIRAHAAKVSDFVARGMPAWHEGGTLPLDYKRPQE